VKVKCFGKMLDVIDDNLGVVSKKDFVFVSPW